LDAAPHARTSEMLSAAPGFFVDHEDGEGLGNDVYLRGFDLEHGSGIEMRVGNIPVNVPSHIQGQGYADVNFIIPEVVRSIRVLEGPYDPRQGDAAIVGSAYFDLGVPERGYRFGATHGSFNQTRIVGIAAPEEANEETFAAFSLRQTDGFGAHRASRSGSVMAQYAVDIGARDRLKLLATGYGARTDSPGVVRQDDVDAGRVGFYDGYARFAGNQGVQSSRVIVGADFDHLEPSGAHFELAPFVMWTDFRARQNFTGALESSDVNPAAAGLGDLFESTNDETALGVTSRFHTAPIALGPAELAAEPGVFVRAGHTDQSRNLTDPVTLALWDRRRDAALNTLDAGAYLDLDLRLWKRLRVSGGVRADVITETIDDHLANLPPPGPASTGLLSGARRDVSGVTVGPRVTAEYTVTESLSPVVSYGEGFRTLDAAHLAQGASHPYSKVRSLEAGLRAQALRGRYTATVVAFETRVGNELVFAAASGGLETERASTRRGVLSSIVTSPTKWLLASTALSITDATFQTDLPGIAHHVPNVPPVVLRADVTLRGRVATVRGLPLNGRVGTGYTFLSRRYLTDAVLAPANHVLNASAALRYQAVEVGVEAYNLIDLRYADDTERYISNWQTGPGSVRATAATHYLAAPPRTVLAGVTVFF
jgi:iron complex outermembrane receptor protein